MIRIFLTILSLLIFSGFVYSQSVNKLENNPTSLRTQNPRNIEETKKSSLITFEKTVNPIYLQGKENSTVKIVSPISFERTRNPSSDGEEPKKQ
tara:strand:+ start:705 stop:986 length:282 start_codon:yes stop_codon:yes gene_type:complete